MMLKEPSTMIDVNGRRLSFDKRVVYVVAMPDRVIVLFDSDDYPEGDPLVGRNVAAFDYDGNMLWRIRATGATRPAGQSRERPGVDVPEAYIGLGVDEDDGKIKATVPSVEFDLDPETGAISNPVQYR